MAQKTCDLLVVGAGPVGCTVAERAASQLGWNVVVLDRRRHIGGNCFDRVTDEGVLVHQYGPHCFRTSDQRVLDYLSQFTGWRPVDYRVRSLIGGRLLPFPINLTTLEQFFGVSLNEASGAALL